MKIRDSGMPEEHVWSDLFDIELILTELQINSNINHVAELGCGYGTFTIPTAQLIQGYLYVFDIETSLIKIVNRKIKEHDIKNVIPKQRDVLKEQTGLPANSMDYVMLFNILHHENPQDLLLEALRILKPGGKAGIIHWRSDIPTPGGPALNIRPTPGNILDWVEKLSFSVHKAPTILKPYHFGLVIAK